MIKVLMLKTAAGPDGPCPQGSTPELDADTALAFIEAGAAQAFVPRKKVVAPTPAVQTDDELLEQYRDEARRAGYAAPGVEAIAQARLLSLRESIPYNEASRRLQDAAKAAAESEKPADATAPAEDPAELERQAQFKELVAGGLSEDEARELVWPKADGDVERAVVTPPETATAPAQRPPRRR
jgi:hypothetical protein